MKNIVIKKNAKPEVTKNSWNAILDSMDVYDAFEVDERTRRVVMGVASGQFHKYTNKVFKSTNKGQPEGKAKIWREK